MRGVAPCGLVVVSGGQASERVPSVVVVIVIAATYRRVTVIVIVNWKGMSICIQMISDPEQLQAMSNREHNLLLSKLLLPY